MSMTESEAIKKLEFLNEALNFQRSDADECSCALQMGMDAIKEIQQYRAIGTVSEFRELKEKATAKKPFGEPSGWTCPNCGEFHSEKQSHCTECNQTILWT